MNSEQLTPEEKARYSTPSISMFGDTSIDWNALIAEHEQQDEADQKLIDAFEEPERKTVVFWVCVLMPIAVAAYLIIHFIKS